MCPLKNRRKSHSTARSFSSNFSDECTTPVSRMAIGEEHCGAPVFELKVESLLFHFFFFLLPAILFPEFLSSRIFLVARCRIENPWNKISFVPNFQSCERK